MDTGPLKTDIKRYHGEGLRPSPAFSQRGFTLTELLVVMVIFLSMVSVLVISMHFSWIESGSEKAAAREAEKFSRWLDGIFFKACLNKRTFQFISLPCSTPVSRIYVKWNYNNSTEVYDSKGKCYFTVRGHKVTQASYNPTWHMLSPGFTLKAVVSKTKVRAVRFIRISPFCFVSVTEDPPDD